jgi:hypothetical protein
MNRAVRTLLMLLVIAAAVAGAINVYADGRPVEATARRLACAGGASCKARMTRVARTPFSQDIQFQESHRTVNVRCRRSLYLVGEYSCALLP